MLIQAAGKLGKLAELSSEDKKKCVRYYLQKNPGASNRQREKTPGQVINEAEELLEIKNKRGTDNQGDRTDLSQNSEKSYGHDSWQEVADEVGVSEGTLSKGFKVKEKARDGDEQPEREKFHTRDEGRAKDKAAEKVNADVSGRPLLMKNCLNTVGKM